MVDYHKMCKSIASRYRVTPDQREDLIQEGYLAYLECVARGCDNPDAIATSIREAMYDYTNFKQRPVEVPADNNHRGLKKRWANLESLEGLGPTERALYFALMGEYVSLDTLDKDLLEESHEDLVTLGMAITQALSEREASVFRKIALHGYELHEVGKAMGVSKQRVDELYQRAVAKLQKRLL